MIVCNSLIFFHPETGSKYENTGKRRIFNYVRSAVDSGGVLSDALRSTLDSAAATTDDSNEVSFLDTSCARHVSILIGASSDSIPASEEPPPFGKNYSTAVRSCSLSSGFSDSGFFRAPSLALSPPFTAVL